MNGILIEEKRSRNGRLIQIVKTNRCGGTYYIVIDGEPGFHSLDLERVEEYMKKML